MFEKKIILGLAIVFLVSCNSKKGDDDSLARQRTETEAAQQEVQKKIQELEEEAERIKQSESELEQRQQRIIRLQEELEAQKLTPEQVSQNPEAIPNRRTNILEILTEDHQMLFGAIDSREAAVDLLNLVQTQQEALVMWLQHDIVEEQAAIEELKRQSDQKVIEANQRIEEAALEAQTILDQARSEAESLVNEASAESQALIEKGEALIVAATSEGEEIKAQAQQESDEIQSQADTIFAEAKEKKELLQVRLAEAAQQEEALASTQKTLVELKDSLAQERVNLDESSAKLAEEIEAARLYFVEQDKSKVFDRLLENRGYPFLITVFGSGLASEITQIRAAIKAQTESSRYPQDFALSPASFSETDYVFVKDRFLTHATAKEIRDLQSELNQKAQQVATATGLRNANFLIIVRPVEKVRAAGRITISGSNAVGWENRLNDSETLATIDISPSEIEVMDFESVDLQNIGQYMFGETSPANCAIPQVDCLVELNRLGLLKNIAVSDHIAFGAGTFDTPKKLFSQLISHSAEKMLREQLASYNQFSVSAEKADHTRWWVEFNNILRMVLPSYATERNYDLIVTPDSLAEVYARLDNFDAISNNYIMESIKIDFSLTLVDEFDAHQALLDTDFFRPSSPHLGEIEIQVPIQSDFSAEYSLGDLSLSQYSDQQIEEIVFQRTQQRPPLRPPTTERFEGLSEELKVKLTEHLYNAESNTLPWFTSSIDAYIEREFEPGEEQDIARKFIEAAPILTQAHEGYKSAFINYRSLRRNVLNDLYQEELILIRRTYENFNKSLLQQP